LWFSDALAYYRIIYIELTAAGRELPAKKVLDRAAAAELNPPGPIRL